MTTPVMRSPNGWQRLSILHTDAVSSGSPRRHGRTERQPTETTDLRRGETELRSARRNTVESGWPLGSGWRRVVEYFGDDLAAEGLKCRVIRGLGEIRDAEIQRPPACPLPGRVVDGPDCRRKAGSSSRAQSAPRGRQICCRIAATQIGEVDHRSEVPIVDDEVGE